MPVPGTDETEFVRVDADLFLNHQPHPVGIPHVTTLGDAVGFSPCAHIRCEVAYLEVSEFIVRRKQWVSFGCALGLLDLDKRLVKDAALRASLVKRLTFGVLWPEHHAIAQIRIVRNGQQLKPLFSGILQESPQILRLDRIKGGEGQVGPFVAAENGVAMEVLNPLGPIRGPFGRNQGRKLAGLVVLGGPPLRGLARFPP